MRDSNLKSAIKLCSALFLVLVGAVMACAEYTTEDLMRMTLESLSYDVEANTARSCGTARITQEGNSGLIIARRAAIVDAQRGLLLLRRAIKEGKPPRSDSVSGNLPPFRVISEDVKEGVYFVEIQADLSRLMREKDTRSILSEILSESANDEEE
ncbi:MAG: hypothetical protein IJQ58_05385 [Synergistaceae bacterium]|nr:hypothetical protein [Synergistaceae bacterium]